MSFICKRTAEDVRLFFSNLVTGFRVVFVPPLNFASRLRLLIRALMNHRVDDLLSHRRQPHA